MAKNNPSIYPMMIPLDDWSATLYRVALPQELKEKMIRLESEAYVGFKAYLGYRLPFDTLRKLLSRYLGIVYMSPVSTNSDDTNWLISTTHVDSNLLGRAMQLWIESFYILEQELSVPRGHNEKTKQLAKEIIDSIGPDTFLCSSNGEKVKLLERGIPVENSRCFDVLPMLVVNHLAGSNISIDGKSLPLWATSTNELITQPNLLFDDDGKDASSLVLHFSVQTIPSSKKAFLNVEISKRRWLSSQPDKKIWLATDKSAYLLISKNQFLEIKGGHHNGHTAWYYKEQCWFETIFPGRKIPEMLSVLENPQEYQLDASVPIYVPYDNQMNWGSHTQGTGIYQMVRKSLFMQIKELLGLDAEELAAIRVCGGNKSDLSCYFADDSFELAQESTFPKALLCALKGRKLKVEVWASYANRESMMAAQTICITVQSHMADCEVPIEVRDLGLWCTPLDAADDKSQRNQGFFWRVKEIENTLENANHPLLCYVVLDDAKEFENQARDIKSTKKLNYLPNVDPKGAIRVGFARSGRLTQFVTRQGFVKSQTALDKKRENIPKALERYQERLKAWEEAGRIKRKPQKPNENLINTVIKNAVLDGYRQLGIINDLHTSKRLQKEIFVGITMQNFTRSVYGKRAQPFPIVTILDCSRKCIDVYCDLVSDEILTYDQFLIAFARYFSEPPKHSRAELYSPQKLHAFLSQFFERNRATIMVENNSLTRKCVRNISNTSITPGSQFADCFTLELVNRNEVLPVTIDTTRLRGIMRIRTSTNHELPDYFTEEKETGFSAPAGVFDLHGTYYSLDSRASQELEAMQFEESVTKKDLFLTHRRLVELYPLFVNRNEILACLEDAHSLRQATIQYTMLRTQLPMPLNMVDRDMLMEYCVQPR